MRTLALLLGTAAAVCAIAHADADLYRAVRVYRVRMDLRTGEVRSVPQPAQRQRTALWDASWFTGFMRAQDGNEVWLDWGDVADTQPGETVVSALRIGYATNSNLAQRPVLDLGFYGAENGFNSPARFPIASFRLTLPNLRDFNIPNLPPDRTIAVFIDLNLPPNAPLVLTGPDIGDAATAPNLPAPNFVLPNCPTYPDPNAVVAGDGCGTRWVQFAQARCWDRSGLRDFGYSYHFRNASAGGRMTGPLLVLPDPNLILAGLCPAPGIEDAYDVFRPCDANLDPNCTSPPGPNDTLVPGQNTRYIGTFFFGGDKMAQFPLVLFAAEAGGGCPGDLNGDGLRDLNDLATLLSHFGLTGGPADGDINGDGLVDLSDLSALLAAFGLACP